MSQKDWILLFLLSDEGRPMGPTHLQKGLFLIQQNMSIPHVFDFSAGDYGPASSEIYRVLAELVEAGDVYELAQGQSYRKWAISLAGAKKAEVWKKSILLNMAKYVERLGVWIRKASYTDMHYVIKKEFTEYYEKAIFGGNP